MGPEYGATIGYFPVDAQTMDYLKLTNRSNEQLKTIEYYSREQGMFIDGNSKDPIYTKTLDLDLASVEPCISGPKRPHDKVPLSVQPGEFKEVLTNKVGFKGFGLTQE